MPDHLRAAVGFAVYAGLRGEILRLRWEHIDLRAGVLTVTKTKSNKDRRVPINPDLADLLRQHPRTLGVKLLFPPPRRGGERTDFRTALKHAAERAGVRLVGTHQLRHAFCSHAPMNGADPRSAQLWIGHSDLRTTMLYAHTSPDHEREAIARVKYADDEAEKPMADRPESGRRAKIDPY